MAVQTRARNAKFDAGQYQGLTRDDLLRIYRIMYLSRRIDDREVRVARAPLGRLGREHLRIERDRRVRIGGQEIVPNETAMGSGGHDVMVLAISPELGKALAYGARAAKDAREHGDPCSVNQ